VSKRLLLATAVLAAAVALVAFLTVPPRRLQLSTTGDGTIPGILHVHSNRSDGRSAPEEIAAAAARAGLKFVVFTDHGDATRAPDPPAYKSGVLCIDGVEISTNQGHYVAIGLPAAPYPLGGDARDVVEDVKRLGGFGIAAHPDSPNPKLAWREWTAPFDGIELVNPDTSWRLLLSEPGAAAKGELATALVDYAFRPTETIAAHLRDSRSIASWQALAARRPVVAIAGVDAHAKLQIGGADDSPYSLPFFGYESAFRLLSVHVAVDSPLSGDAARDAVALLSAVRAGHLYTVVDGLASPPSFEVIAANREDTVRGGDSVQAGGGVSIHIRGNAPASYTTVVHRGTTVLASARDAEDWTVHASEEPAVYWVEIVAPIQPRPIAWLRSNPIYVRAAPGKSEAVPPPPPVQTVTTFDGQSAAGWQVEHDAMSLGAVELADEAGAHELRFRYGLAGGTPISQFAALVRPTAGVVGADRLAFTIRGEKPMRISVQLRARNADRWQRSIYVDSTPQEHAVRFDDMTPAGITRTPTAPPADVDSVLFVVDLTNNRPGQSGRIWLSSVRLER
jgi:hypothetical protein